VLSALVATNAPAVLDSVITKTTGLSVNAPNPNDPVEKELKKLMAEDDDAQAEVDDWLRDNDRFRAKGAGISDAEMNRRIRKRFDPVRQGYEDLIKRYPTNANARVAFASFLKDLGDSEGEVSQLEKARELDPKDPAIWNNLANYYGEFGPATNAFAYFEKAIELDPTEPVYYENFADAVCMLRKDAREYYQLTEQDVFDKSLALYTRATKLAPDNFPLAANLAETFYIIRPLRLEAALQAWTNALNTAHNDIEREGVHIHLARLKAGAGRFDEARAHLDTVTNPAYAELKKAGARNIALREQATAETNGSPAAATKPGGSSAARQTKNPPTSPAEKP
jgi:tetratricopeptide (TPR) repeat protein